MEFNAENGSFAIIDVELKAADTVVVVRDTALLPSDVPFKMKIKKLNSNNRIIQQEIVYVTAVVGKNLTITRAAEKIPYGENDTTFTQSALDFDGGDIMELVFTAEDGKKYATEINSLEDRKIERVNTVGIFEDYTFDGEETNNTQFNVDTTTAETTLTIDLSLFPTTNGLYQFTVVKTSGDSNAVILDFTPGSISGQSFIELVNENQIVKFVIESGTTATIISEKNEPTEQVEVRKTTINKVTLDDFTAGETAFLDKYQIGIQDFGIYEQVEVQSRNFGLSENIDGIIVSPDESQIGLVFDITSVGVNMYVYDLSIPGDLTTVGSPTIYTESQLDLYIGDKMVYSYDGNYVYSGVDYLYMVPNNQRIIYRATLSTPYDLNTIGQFSEYLGGYNYYPTPSGYDDDIRGIFSIPFFSDDGTKIIFDGKVNRTSDNQLFLLRLVYETDTLGEFKSNNVTLLDYRVYDDETESGRPRPWQKGGKYLGGSRLSSPYGAYSSETSLLSAVYVPLLILRNNNFYDLNGARDTIIKYDVSNCFYQEIEFGTNSKQQLSQEFIGLGYLEQITISTSLYGTIDNNIIVEIQGDNNGEPDGNVIFTSTEVIGASLNISSKTVSIQTTLDTNTRYHLVFKSQVALDDDNYYLLQGNKEREIASMTKYYDGTNWVSSDMSIAIEYTDYYGAQKDGSRYLVTGESIFLGMANTNTSAGNILEINRVYDNNQSGLTPNNTYRPGSTPGTIEISTSKVGIGNSISETELTLWDGLRN